MMRKSVGKLYRRVEEGLTLLSTGCIVAMMVITVGDVILRAGFHLHFKGSYQYCTLLFVPVIYFGLAYAQRQDMHITVPLFYPRIPLKGRYIVEGIILIVCIVMFGALTYYALQSAYSNMADTIMGAIQVKTWPARFAVPIGTGAICLRLLVQFVRLVARRELYEEAVKMDDTKVIEE